MKTLEEIKEVAPGLDGAEVVKLLDEYISRNPDDDEAYTMRGMKHFSLGMRKEAIEDYMKAVQLNPDSRAGQALRATYDILNYYNKDLYNP